VRIAKIFDSHDETGRAVFGLDRERLRDEDERDNLVRYLRAGRLVLSTTGRDEDRLAPELGRVVPMSFRTDGEWVWSESLAYYVSEHGIAPEQELRDHVGTRGHAVTEVSDDAVREATRLVLGR
jgi:hypothetical protein